MVNFEFKSKLIKHLRTTVVGDIDGIEDVASSVILYLAGLAHPTKPIGSFILSGPTGVGKTWLVESLAKFLHGSEKNVLRVDCGSYSNEHEVAKLLGSPPGYLGHKESPPLLAQKFIDEVSTEACNISLVLFDEVDKAARSVTTTLLSVLDKAELRLGDNTLSRFGKTMVFFTSNYGQDKVQKLLSKGIGFSGAMATDAEIQHKAQAIVRSTIRKSLTPEFINRIDYWLTFSPLKQEDVELILQLEIKKLNAFLNERLGPLSNIRVAVTPEARRWLLENGYSREYGCRALQRLLKKQVLERLADYIVGTTNKEKLVNGRFTYFDIAKDGDGLQLRLSSKEVSLAA